MKRYIKISMIISVMFFVVNCTPDPVDTTTGIDEVYMIKGKDYTIITGQRIIKREDNTLIKIYSIKNGTTTATLVSGSAVIK